MTLIPLNCPSCGSMAEAIEGDIDFKCSFCGVTSAISSELKVSPSAAKFIVLAERAIGKGQFGKALELCGEGLKYDPHNDKLQEMEVQCESSISNLSTTLDDEFNKLNEAEVSHLQATHILNELQANIEVYGSNSPLSGATPADVRIGIRYIDRAIEIQPDNPTYLNTKALLLSESGEDKAQAIKLFERAHELNPRNITIEENLKGAKSDGCFVATAAHGSPDHPTVKILRRWRDECLETHKIGALFVDFYYKISPSAAKKIEKNNAVKFVVRGLLRVFIAFLPSKIR